MWRYMMKRLVLSVVTIWFIATATFFGMHAVPGDPVLTRLVLIAALAGRNAIAGLVFTAA